MAGAPQLELVYFNLAARAEPTRIALHHAKVPFKDTRLAFENWPDFKKNTPAAKLPMLYVESSGNSGALLIAAPLVA